MRTIGIIGTMDLDDLFSKLTGASVTYADNRHITNNKGSAFLVLIADEYGDMAEAYGATVSKPTTRQSSKSVMCLQSVKQSRKDQTRH